jgi:hypothetical protein
VDSPAIASADVVRALGREPGEWRAARLAVGSSRGGGGIWRLAGADWSLVLKVIVRHARADRGGDLVDEPGHFFYWRREPLAYASGLLDDLPGLRAPRCERVEERADGGYHLWLEDVADEGGWTLERYALAARHLGRFNGAYPRGRPLPEQPWLHRGFGPLWRAESEEAVAPFRRPETWADPRARALLPERDVRRVLAAWDERGRLEQLADGAPTTLCHYDAFRGNMAAAGQETVLFDWEYVGLGALGQDPAHLAVESLFMGHVPGGEAGALDAAVFAGYLAGLADAGWRGDAPAVRRAYCASASRRWLTTAVRRAVQAATCDDPALRARFERWMGMPIEECARQLADVTRLLLGFAEDAHRGGPAPGRTA